MSRHCTFESEPVLTPLAHRSAEDKSTIKRAWNLPREAMVSGRSVMYKQRQIRVMERRRGSMRGVLESQIPPTGDYQCKGGPRVRGKGFSELDKRVRVVGVRNISVWQRLTGHRPLPEDPARKKRKQAEKHPSVSLNLVRLKRMRMLEVRETYTFPSSPQLAKTAWSSPWTSGRQATALTAPRPCPRRISSSSPDCRCQT